jgi:pyruvate/2-oxoglutarate dehydrogenase complex dihydrolipoamide acyltransferase (E2) component
VAREVRLPNLGMNILEATVQEWLVSEGDAVTEGQDLVAVETDKVETVLPAPMAGTVAQIVAPAGETVPIGEILVLLED